MKSHNLHRRRYPTYNLGITLCGFLIVILIAFFMLDYDNFKELNSGYDFIELCSRYELIQGEDVYEFMNCLIREDSNRTDSYEITKIMCFSLRHSLDISKAILKLDTSIASKSDIVFMLAQMNSNSMLWDSTKLSDCWFLKPSDMAKIKDSDTTDYWDEYRRLFGNSAKQSYSKPIFNRNNTVAVIEYSYSGGWFIGAGGVAIYAKEDGTWKFVKEIVLWIS